jgi:DNA polymerase-3 subunit delta'
MMYPWLEASLKRLVGRGQGLPHGLLLTGPEGIGKLSLATEIARSILCENIEDKLGCNRCRGCRLFRAGNHPDYHLLTTEETVKFGDPNLCTPGERYLVETNGQTNSRTKPKRIIGVSQVRALTEELQSTSHFGGGKVVIIYPTDALNLNASNALLKTLEEPTDGTQFLLVTAVLHALPATIRSRCSHFRLTLPDEADTLKWLQDTLSISIEESMELLELANGSPLQALKLFDDESRIIGSSLEADLAAILSGKSTPTSISKKWGKANVRMTIRWLQREMLKAFRAGVNDETSESSRQVYDRLGRCRCLAIYQETGAFLKWPPSAVDETLFLESVIVKMLEPGFPDHNG